MGQTHAYIFCSTQTNLTVRIGSIGKPLPRVEVAVVDEKGRILPPCETGHLVIRRDFPGLFKEHFKMPE